MGIPMGFPPAAPASNTCTLEKPRSTTRYAYDVDNHHRGYALSTLGEPLSGRAWGVHCASRRWFLNGWRSANPSATGTAVGPP